MYFNYYPEEVMNVQEEIVKWAEKYVPEFNKLSEKYNTSYYTQSPLNCIDGEVDLMLIGINPKGNLGEGSSKKTTEEYLARYSSVVFLLDPSPRFPLGFIPISMRSTSPSIQFNGDCV